MSSIASPDTGSTATPSRPRRRPAVRRRMRLSDCQRRLLLVWYIGAAPTFLVLIAQTLLSLYEGYGLNANEVWGWFLPSVMPTLLLVTGVVAAEARNPSPQEQTVERYYFRLAFGLSLFYLVVVNLILLAMPFILQQVDEAQDIIRYLNKSNLFLGPVQGLVGAAMGAVFTSTK